MKYFKDPLYCLGALMILPSAVAFYLLVKDPGFISSKDMLMYSILSLTVSLFGTVLMEKRAERMDYPERFKDEQ